MSSRQKAVAGMFYPESCKEIERNIDQFNQALDDADCTPPTDFVPRALIAPHAGYVYSGFTANIAYRTAALNTTGIKRVIIIGPSHKVFISGASIALYERYDSPCGELDDYAQRAHPGVRRRSLRWAFAWKVPPKEEITTLEGKRATP